MKGKRTKRSYKRSMTSRDWKRFERLSDNDIDTSDIPELGPDFWKQARVVFPKKKQSIALRVEEDILEWFKQGGRGYQSRMLAVLRSYVNAQRSVH